jgi:predicted dehydrogenase
MINIAIVGYGYWGPKLFKAFSENMACFVKYICDKDEINLAKNHIKYHGTKSTRDIEVLLKDPDLTAVVIATPISTHYELAKKFLQAGKHVLVEKPLASKVEDAQELIDLAKRKKLILMVDHTFIYHSAVRKVKELISSGKLGEIYFIDSSRVNLGIYHPDASVIWDLMPHDVSILVYWMAELPISVAAFAKGCINPNKPDVAFVNFQFASSVLANINVSWLAPAKLRNIVIVGSEKMVLFDDDEPVEKIRIFQKGVKSEKKSDISDVKIDYFHGDIVSPLVVHYEPLAVMANHFISCIAKNEEPLTSGREGLEIVKVLAAIQKSVDNKGKLIKIKS